MNRMYIGQRVKIYGQQDSINFNGEEGRIISLVAPEPYDFAVDFMMEIPDCHTCFLHRKSILLRNTGYWFQTKRVQIEPVLRDSFLKDGEE